MNEKITGVSYDRLVEICTRLKDMLKEDYNADTIINHLNTEYDLDLDLNEIGFIGFYEEDDEDEEEYCCIFQDMVEGRR